MCIQETTRCYTPSKPLFLNYYLFSESKAPKRNKCTNISGVLLTELYLQDRCPREFSLEIRASITIETKQHGHATGHHTNGKHRALEVYTKFHAIAAPSNSITCLCIAKVGEDIRNYALAIRVHTLFAKSKSKGGHRVEKQVPDLSDSS